jgi:hypothetical protein
MIFFEIKIFKNLRNSHRSAKENKFEVKFLELKDKTDIESPETKERGLLSVVKFR